LGFFFPKVPDENLSMTSEHDGDGMIDYEEMATAVALQEGMQLSNHSYNTR
jgi:hypothetical protein